MASIVDGLRAKIDQLLELESIGEPAQYKLRTHCTRLSNTPPLDFDGRSSSMRFSVHSRRTGRSVSTVNPPRKIGFSGSVPSFRAITPVQKCRWREWSRICLD